MSINISKVYISDTSGPLVEGCGCFRCYHKRASSMVTGDPITDIQMDFGFRYACEICGNKRCPHHTDHRNQCTNSNEPGQPGSDYQ